MNIPPRKSIPFDLPATYQISIQGQIDPTWSDHLGSMTIFPATVEADPPITTLQGELRDQAALVGVLIALYEMQLTLIFVKRVDNN